MQKLLTKYLNEKAGSAKNFTAGYSAARKDIDGLMKTLTAQKNEVDLFEIELSLFKDLAANINDRFKNTKVEYSEEAGIPVFSVCYDTTGKDDEISAQFVKEQADHMQKIFTGYKVTTTKHMPKCVFLDRKKQVFPY